MYRMCCAVLLKDHWDYVSVCAIRNGAAGLGDPGVVGGGIS